MMYYACFHKHEEGGKERIGLLLHEEICITFQFFNF